VVVHDLSKPGAGELLRGHLRALRISVDVLVNNAGFGSYGAFESLNAAAEQQQIAVNVGAVVDLCHAFVPDMLRKGSGAVLNIASTAAFQPGPYMATYAATKAFVLSFSEALWAEYRHRGVHVAALCPGAVDTAFIDKLGNSAVRDTAVFARTLPVEQVASAALRALLGSAPSRIVGLRNWLTANSLRMAPRAAVASAAARMLKPSST
jgi:short-subunit dehydrogenase